MLASLPFSSASVNRQSYSGVRRLDMQNERLIIWIQIITGFAVILGLILVIWELRQTREIAVAQQIGDSHNRYSTQLQALMGEESASAVAKACDNPKALTTEDMIVLDYFYTEIINRMRVQYDLEHQTQLATHNWRSWTANFYTVFATDYGRWWWSNARFEPEIMEAGSAILETTTFSCLDRYDAYRSQFDDA